MKIYISGSISAKTNKEVEKNLQRFIDKKEELTQLGIDAYNPAEGEPANKEWEYYLARDIDVLYKRDFDAIYMMKGWEKSLGARLEKEVALNLRLKIIYE